MSTIMMPFMLMCWRNLCTWYDYCNCAFLCNVHY